MSLVTKSVLICLTVDPNLRPMSCFTLGAILDYDNGVSLSFCLPQRCHAVRKRRMTSHVVGLLLRRWWCGQGLHPPGHRQCPLAPAGLVLFLTIMTLACFISAGYLKTSPGIFCNCSYISVPGYDYYYQHIALIRWCCTPKTLKRNWAKAHWFCSRWNQS